MVILLDSRELNPHPWERYLPSALSFEHCTVESGDLALASHQQGAVVEREAPADLAACIGTGRERFERELKRGRYCGKFIVVVEGSLSDVVCAARAIHANATIGMLATWTLRYCPFILAGSERLAADFRFQVLNRAVADVGSTRRAHNQKQSAFSGTRGSARPF
jgi:DNA excision repair protein ERCC-4